MAEMLPRGFTTDGHRKVTRMIAAGEDWQIYLTNTDTYVLAVSESLFSSWEQDFLDSADLFARPDDLCCRVLWSSSEYLISSLDQGPYPHNSAQIEAFCAALNAVKKHHLDINLEGAIYIEEYSLLLPVLPASEESDNALAFGKWLTNGVNVSVSSFERVKTIMTWLPEDVLAKYISMAGFDVPVISKTSLEKTEAASFSSENAKAASAEIETKGDFQLPGRPELENFFRENIIDVVLNYEHYKRMGVSFPGATILYGPPGCGKTYAVRRLSEFLGWKRFDIDSGTIASSYIHDTSKKISEVFQAAIQSAPSILVIDEMEAFLSARGMSVSSGTHHLEEVAEFLRQIPEAVSAGVLVFAMTNMIDLIDPAILRRGRFDQIIEVKMPTAEEIEALLRVKFRELPVDDTVDIHSISAALAEHPMSDVDFVIREAGRYAAKNRAEVIDRNCFDQALDQLPKKKEQRKIGF